MWYNRPAYSSYIHPAYGHWNFEDPNVRAIARERAAREREAAARRAEFLHWQRMQDVARSPYNSYLSDDDSVIPYPYNLRPNDYDMHEDLRRQQVLEQQRQFELARQAEINRQREERARESEEHVSRRYEPTFTSAPHFSVPVSSPGGSPSTTPRTEPTRLSESPSPPPSPYPATLAATPEQIRAAMTIQEFYRSRVARQQALASIAELSTQFEQLKSAFSPPRQLDYRGGPTGDVITIPVSSESPVQLPSILPSSGNAERTTETSKSHPALAFTSNNKAVLEYVENLNRLEEKLDRVDSGGHASVREQRKQLIRNVEAEAQRMDRWIAAVWKLAQPPEQVRPKPQSTRQLRPQPTMEDVLPDN